jgi:hypothetical protein
MKPCDENYVLEPVGVAIAREGIDERSLGAIGEARIHNS